MKNVLLANTVQRLISAIYYGRKCVLMAQKLARRDWRSGGPWFKSHPRLTYQSWSSYQLNQLGSKTASDSTLKQLTTCGVWNICTFFYFFSLGWDLNRGFPYHQPDALTPAPSRQVGVAYYIRNVTKMCSSRLHNYTVMVWWYGQISVVHNAWMIYHGVRSIHVILHVL